MNKKVCAILVMTAFLSMSSVAWAGFFNDGRWYMASSQWDLVTGGDPGDRGVLTDSDDRLNWTATSGWESGWTDGYNAFELYGSKWVLDLNDDFQLYVNFHYDYTATHADDEGSVNMTLNFIGDGGVPTHGFTIAAKNGAKIEDEVLVAASKFRISIVDPSGTTDNFWDRSSPNGSLLFSYDFLEDKLLLRGMDTGGVTVARYYSGLRTIQGVTELNVFLGGWSQGAGLEYGEAYLHNFQVVKGIMTPEPASIFLFMLGGGSLFLLRKKRR